MNEPSTDLCVSVVSGNDRALTLGCLESLVRSLDGSLKTEIHLVDNAAPPDWFSSVRQTYPQIKVHRNERRRGFGANHNAIMASIDARYYLLLNDDTIVFDRLCEELVHCAETFENAGFIGPKILNPDRTIQTSVYRFPTIFRPLFELLQLGRLLGFLKIFDDYRAFGYDRQRPVDFVSGAAILARKKMLDQIGLLDEEFFMYAEETDWCLRAKRAGWDTLFTPAASLIHFGGQSTLQCAPERSVEFLRSHERLIKKHFGYAGLITFRLSNFLKHVPRLIYGKLKGLAAAKIMAEADTVLWSIGLLKRPGLSEMSTK